MRPRTAGPTTYCRASRIGFYVLDADWRFVYFNDYAERYLGKHREDVIGRTLFEVHPQSKTGLIPARFGHVMAERTPVRFEALSSVTRRWCFFAVSPTREGGISVYFRDISEQKRIEGEMAAAKEAAERADRAKSKFLAAASHDLRQPVQSLVLLMALAERQIAAQQPGALATLRMMQEALGGLNGLLNAILDISRLEAGVEAQSTAVDLDALLGRIASEYEPKATEQGLDLRVLPRTLWVEADRTLLERALRNLIDNALRYTEDGGVVIGARRRGDRVRIDVIDTGIGVPRDKVKDIFEEFVQLNNPGRQLGQGIGLGLAIVSRIADLISATIEVNSNEGRGSRFSLTLPAVDPKPASLPDRPEDMEDPGGRVLIVEDNALVRCGLEAMLAEWGYDIISAEDGETALELGERDGWRFGSIVTDHRLGAGLTGVQTAKEILRRSGRTLPTLVLTGDTGKEAITEIDASGFEVMHKPIAAETLRRTVARMMGA